MSLSFEDKVIRALKPKFDLLLKPFDGKTSPDESNARSPLKSNVDHATDYDTRSGNENKSSLPVNSLELNPESFDNDITLARNQDGLLYSDTNAPGGARKADDDDELKDFVRQYPRINPLLYATIFSLFAAMGGFLGGYDTGITSGAMVYIKDQYKLDDVKTEVIVSGVVAGAIFGSLISGNLSDRYGRKFVSVISALTYMLGGILMSTAQGFGTLFMGRIVTGLAVGSGSIAPVYIGEVVPSEYRGAFVNANAFLIALGQFVSYLTAYALSGGVHYQRGFNDTNNQTPSSAEKGNWRLMLGLTIVPPLLQILLTPLMPQSPRFLNSKNYTLDSAKTLLLVYPVKRPREEIINRVITIKTHNKLSKNEKGRQASYISFLKKPEYRRLVLITSTLQALQQLSGINTIMYYSAFILRMAGFPTKSSSILFSTIIGLANSIGSLFSMYTVNRFRRRPLLLTTLVGVFFALLNLTLTFRRSDNNNSGDISSSNVSENAPISKSSYLALSSVVAYVIFYSLGLGCVPWNLVSEIFPMEARSRGAAFAVATNWIFNFLVSVTFLTLVKHITASGTFFLYSLFMAFGFFFIYFLVPETKNKSLEADCVTSVKKAEKPVVFSH